jgi:hypothetical protein
MGLKCGMNSGLILACSLLWGTLVHRPQCSMVSTECDSQVPWRWWECLLAILQGSDFAGEACHVMFWQARLYSPWVAVLPSRASSCVVVSAGGLNF